MEPIRIIPVAPSLEKSLERRGYKWLSTNPETIGKMISEVLRRIDAECYMMDVHTAEKTYRNLFCSWLNYHNLVNKTLQIRFDRDTGSGFNINFATIETGKGEGKEIKEHHIT